jgi:hypothetical protein
MVMMGRKIHAPSQSTQQPNLQQTALLAARLHSNRQCIHQADSYGPVSECQLMLFNKKVTNTALHYGVFYP